MPAGIARPAELVPDRADVLGGNADTGVRDLDGDGPLALRPSNLDDGFGARVFRGVRDEVVHSRIEQVGVAGHMRKRPGRLREAQGERSAFPACGELLGHGVDGVARGLLQIHVLDVDRGGLQLGEFAQIGQQAAHAQGLRGDDRPARILGVVAGRGGSQRRQRILQLVVEAAEKLAVGLAQLFLAGFQPVGVLSFSAASPGEGDPSAQAEKQPGGGEQSRKRELHKEVAGLARKPPRYGAAEADDRGQKHEDEPAQTNPFHARTAPMKRYPTDGTVSM
jgi:hypothetical protein